MSEHREFLERFRSRRHGASTHVSDRQLLVGVVLLLEVLMGQVEDLQASVDGLVSSTNDAKERVTIHLDALTTHITELEAAVAAGQAPDLSSLRAEVDAARGTVESIDPALAVVSPDSPAEAEAGPTEPTEPPAPEGSAPPA